MSPQFLGWVAGLGGGLRIVSPEPVVREMQTLVQHLAEQYCVPDGALRQILSRIVNHLVDTMLRL